MASGWVLDSLEWDSIRYGNAELDKVRMTNEVCMLLW